MKFFIVIHKMTEWMHVCGCDAFNEVVCFIIGGSCVKSGCYWIFFLISHVMPIMSV